MTILSGFYPESHPWALFEGFHGFASADPYRYIRWNNESLDRLFYGGNGRNVVSIPIQRENSSYKSYSRPSSCFELDDYDSESDLESWDREDLNQNSLPMRRKRRHEIKKTSSNGSDHCAISENDIDSSHLQSPSKMKVGENTSGFEKPVNDIVERRYRTRAAHADKNVIFVDNDDECEINELTTYDVYKHLKIMLEKCGRCIDEMRGDGNCFFRALSKVVYGNQKFYDDIRIAIVDLIEKFPKKFEAVTDGPVSSHIEAMRQDKTWATQTEIYAAATLLGRSIYILSPDQSGENYKWLLFSPLFKYQTGKLDDPCYITICHTHGNHYDRVAPLKGKCNCDLDPPELSGIKDSVDLTVDYDEIV